MPGVFLVSDTHFGHAGVLRCLTMRNGVKKCQTIRLTLNSFCSIIVF